MDRFSLCIIILMLCIQIQTRPSVIGQLHIFVGQPLSFRYCRYTSDDYITSESHFHRHVLTCHFGVYSKWPEKDSKCSLNQEYLLFMILLLITINKKNIFKFRKSHVSSVMAPAGSITVIGKIDEKQLRTVWYISVHEVILYKWNRSYRVKVNLLATVRTKSSFIGCFPQT